jgi:hypothetical protein
MAGGPCRAIEIVAVMQPTANSTRRLIKLFVVETILVDR